MIRALVDRCTNNYTELHVVCVNTMRETEPLMAQLMLYIQSQNISILRRRKNAVTLFTNSQIIITNIESTTIYRGLKIDSASISVLVDPLREAFMCLIPAVKLPRTITYFK